MQLPEGLPANWADLMAAEMATEMGCTYTGEQIGSPQWCSLELARLGYSISLTLETLDSANARMRAMGRPGVAQPDVLAEPKWTYQLWGPRYPSRGAHPCPLMPTIELAAATALYNIVRLDFEEAKQQQQRQERRPRARHH